MGTGLSNRPNGALFSACALESCPLSDSVLPRSCLKDRRRKLRSGGPPKERLWTFQAAQNSSVYWVGGFQTLFFGQSRIKPVRTGNNNSRKMSTAECL